MIHDLEDFSAYRSILCLHGDLPPLSFFLKMNVPVIAADGAANALISMGIKPSLIIGDLDSVEESILKQHAFLHLPDQNSTDFQKSLDYLKKNNLLPALVVGIHGGYLDHVLHNINLFIKTDCLLYAPPLKGLVIKTGSVMEFILPLNTKMSLLGVPEAKVSTEGLKWDLNQTSLAFPGASSCFNRSRLPQVRIQVYTGNLLLLIYETQINDAGGVSVIV